MAGALRKVAREIRKPVRNIVAGMGVDARPGTLVLVTGGGDWVLKQISLALREHLAAVYPDIQIIDLLGERPYLTQANVHCLCRPAFFTGAVIPELHRSNRVVVTWQHGGRSSGSPTIRAACAQLEEHWRAVRRLIVPNSVTLRDVLECGVDPDRIDVIPNGVDTALFRPPAGASERLACRRALHIPDDAFVVGSFQRDEDDAGQPKLVKGPDILVETVIRAREQMPVHVLLAGPSREYVRTRLEAAGVPHTYKRAEGAADLLRFFYAADAYLISSREEGGPVTLGESLASGVPVVSTRVGMPADVIQDGVSGLLADVGDSEQLARHLNALFVDAGLRQRFIGEGLRAVGALDVRVIARRHQDETYRQAFS
jgi:glycosyltransferase involved in cell wall biosynthesis